MQDNPSKIIVDTNLWISFLISGNIQLEQLLLSGKVILIFSQELLEEFLTVAHRPKFQRFFNTQSIEAILLTISQYVKFETVSSYITLCRDPKDDFLLALAMDSQADFLVTGDSDLLEIKQIGNARILTMTAFLQTMTI